MRKITAGKVTDVAVTYIILIAVSAVFLFPVIWLLLGSFSDSGGIYSSNGFFPDSFSFKQYKNLFLNISNTDPDASAGKDYVQWFLNTLFISGLSCLFGTILVILTAYTMSRFKFKSRKSLMKGTLILGMFPAFMAMTAVYIMMAEFNFVNRLWGLVLIYSAGAPMGYMVQKGFFDTISNSIDEAARIDGASNLTIFIRIILPLSLPIIVYTSLTAFAWPWSDFILPKLLLTVEDKYTVAVGLMTFSGNYDEFGRFSAGSMFVAVPIIILYFCLTRFLVSGLSSGAVKE